MRSPRQVELPPWTAQFVCVFPYLILAALAAGALYGSEAAAAAFVPFAFVCQRVTKWVLRVPGDDPPLPPSITNSA
ncbi:hypothetical protein [Lacipirellula sp.]|uniref:hypothetical protein n=1 Tax=Lacipirellula sp. TaxID=2691419 RepID=UPI003D141A04